MFVSRRWHRVWRERVGAKPDTRGHASRNKYPAPPPNGDEAGKAVRGTQPVTEMPWVAGEPA